MDTTNREAPQERRERLEAPETAQINLSTERKRVRAQAGWHEHGHAATTLFKYPDLRAVLIGMKSGARIPEHQSEGRLSLQCLSGRVHIHAREQEVELLAGHLLTLEHSVPHSLEAFEDSDLLLTIALPLS
jgi:quercetin dioxygenase-like cupin family protein